MKSPLMRGRELKHIVRIPSAQGKASPLMRGRELKHIVRIPSAQGKASPLMRGRELKRGTRISLRLSIPVAPYAGA